mmetsp:Transcript_29403/g.28548  ORF Transcript_29403/g.28548 Transcript_29403/m.28548 type:complete len:240 (+) Transcript_29403:451-1170(+)
MIMEAHIGIGIKGKEGTQAVRSADYSISQFKFLQRVLMVHGRLGYIRISQMICYYFYKNVILVFTEIYFAFVNGFSGQIFFLDWLSTLYNAFFTSWTCLFAYLLEKDINDEFIQKYPKVYQAGQVGAYFSYGKFWKWMFQAIFHGIVTYFMVMKPNSENPWTDSGRSLNHWLSSTIIFTLIIHLVMIKLFVETNYWNMMSILAAIFSLIIYYVVIALGSFNGVAVVFQNEVSGAMKGML